MKPHNRDVRMRFELDEAEAPRCQPLVASGDDMPTVPLTAAHPAELAQSRPRA